MANETLTIQVNDARMTVIGKSWADTSTDSGDGGTLKDLTLEELEDLGFDLPDDLTGDDDFIIGNLPDYDHPVILWEDGIYELVGLDLNDLDLDWEMNTDFSIGDYEFYLNDDFDILQEELPTYIEITSLPYPGNLKYKDGEKISIVGIVVTAYCEDGTPWDSDKHTIRNGRIKNGELEWSPKIAGYLSMDDIIERSDRFSTTVTNRHFTATANDYASAFINENDEKWMRVTFLSEKQGACGTFNGSTAYANTLVYANGSDKLYMSNQYNYSHDCDEQLIPYYNTYVPLDADAIRSELNTVVISWARPCDGQVLTASYEITIVPDEEEEDSGS